MISVKKVSKSYPQLKGEAPLEALKDISLEVSHSELFGLIGPDGAGKTTLIRLLTTLLLPDEGTLTVDGHDTVSEFKAIRDETGYMPGKFSLYLDLTVQENINFFATIFNTTFEQNYDLIKGIYLQLEPFKNRRAGKLSGGMKQKLALCCALIHKPKVLFLDEPTTGVDAVSRMEFWEMLNNLKKQGITIFVSTPYMDEAGKCDRIALIQDGEIMKIDTPQNIVDSFENPLLAVRGRDMLDLLHNLIHIPQTQDVYAFGEFHHVVLPKGADIDLWESEAKARFGTDLIILPAKVNVEDSFIYLMKSKHELS